MYTIVLLTFALITNAKLLPFRFFVDQPQDDKPDGFLLYCGHRLIVVSGLWLLLMCVGSLVQARTLPDSVDTKNFTSTTSSDSLGGSSTVIDSTNFGLTPSTPPVRSATDFSPFYGSSIPVASLTSSPAGGVFTIDSRTATFFEPTSLSLGQHSVVYSITNPAGETASTPQVATTQQQSPDYQALVDLYNSANGAQWRYKMNWLTGNSPCGWYGIACDNNQRVIKISLHSNRLTGPLPASLSNLTSLTVLEMSSNQLSGSIPDSFSALTNLTILSLHNNTLSGSIPNSLSALTKLTNLSLNVNQLSGAIPAGIANLTNLSVLSLYLNQLTGPIPSGFSKLTKLHTLSLSNNRLTGPLPASLSNLTSLTVLEMSSNQLSGSIPDSFSALTNLTKLNLASNTLGGSIPNSFSALTKLTNLSLNVNQLSGPIPAGIANLTNLYGLSLSSNQLTGPIPSGLAKLTKLQYLYLDNNQLSGCFPQALTALCGRVENIEVWGNPGLPTGGFCSGSGTDGFVVRATASPNPATLGSTLSLSVTPGTGYRWQGPNGFSSTLQTPTLPINSPQQSGVYSVTVNNGSTTCWTSATTSLTVHNLASPTILELANYYCLNATPVKLVGSPAGGTFTIDGKPASLFEPASLSPGQHSVVYSITNSAGEAAAARQLVTIQAQSPDYQAMVDLYNATNGAQWRTKTDWLTSCSPCGWYGVSCDNNQRVTQIRLADNRLSGSLPASLTTLSSLTSLELGQNQLSGPLPASIATLSNLTFLELSHNRLSGSIPNSFSALNKLTNLDLTDNALSGSIPNSLSALTNLNNLSLNANQLSGPIPAGIANLTHLVYIGLSNNQLTGSIPGSLAKLTKLQYLYLNNNQLSGCFSRALTAMCGRTEDIHLEDNPELPSNDFCYYDRGFDGFVVRATASPNPATLGSTLSLSVTPGTGYRWQGPNGFSSTLQTPTLPINSPQQSGVYSVTVNNGSTTCWTSATTSLTVHNLASPTILELANYYCLNATPVKLVGSPAGGTFTIDGKPASLFEPASLSPGQHSVVYSITNSAGEAAAARQLVTIQAQSPDYQAMVDLYNATNGAQWRTKTDWLTSCSPCGWYGVSCDNNQRVTQIRLADNRLSGSLPASLTTLSSLTSLELGQNQLSGPLPASIATLSNLTFLELSHNRLSGSIPNSFSALNKLTYLSLNANQLSGPVPANLSTLTNLFYIGLSNNQLTGSIPGSLAKLTKLRHLYLDNNQLSGCFSRALTAMCGRTEDIHLEDNPELPSNDFCYYDRGFDGFVVRATASPNPATLGSTLSLSVTPGTGYRWQGPNGFSSTLQTPTLPISSPQQSGVYSVTVNNGSTTCWTSATTSLTVATQPQPQTLSITGVSTLSCETISPNQKQVRFTPHYSGQTSQPLSFWVTNETKPSTQPGPYSLTLYTDNPTITLQAQQGGNLTAYTYHWLADCPAGPNLPPTPKTIPDQTTTLDQPYQLELSAFFTDPEQQPLSFVAQGLPAGLSLRGSLISGSASVTGVSTLRITAQDPGGLWATTSLKLTVSPTPTQPQTLSITGVSTLSCETISPNQKQVRFTPHYSGQTSQPLSFWVTNETKPSTQPGPYSLTLYTDNPTITLQAQQANNLTTYTYNWLADCPSTTDPDQGLRMVSVTTLSCETISPSQKRIRFTPHFSGQTSAPISFWVRNETTPTTQPGPYTLTLYTDNPTITLQAQQAGTLASYAYHWLGACSSAARLGSGASEADLQLKLLGNPVLHQSAEVEIRGAGGQPLLLRLSDLRGRLLYEQSLDGVSEAQRVRVPVSGGQGVLLLEVRSATQRQQLKLVRP